MFCVLLPEEGGTEHGIAALHPVLFTAKRQRLAVFVF